MGKSKIVYGSRTFESGDIKSGNCYLAVSLLSDSLEMNTLDFEVESEDATLTAFVRNTPLTYFNDGEQVGIFFVQKVTRLARTRYSFACTSAMGLLDETDHYGGMYTGETVGEVVSDICGGVAHHVKSNLKKIALYGYLPKATRRENLSQVLFAIGATVKSDLDGYLRIEGLWDTASGTIGENRVYTGGEVEAITPVTRVVVTEHQYLKGTESKTLFEGTTADSDIIVFDEPMHNLTAEGFTILENGVNYAKVSTGNGTLTGTAYIHSTREVSKPVTPAETENVVRVEDATLVSLANANAVANRLAVYYAARESVTQDVAYDGELPGDVVDMAHPYGGTVRSCIESVDLTLSCKLRSREKHLVGYIPQGAGVEEYYDFSQQIDQDGTWIVPDNVFALRVVLIGGGNGGAPGEPGQPGEVLDELAYSYDTFGGAGGAGGAGGIGGIGGNIYMQELAVAPAMRLTVSIGRGGVSNDAGAHTILEAGKIALTSAAGAPSESGYINLFTGALYALPGINGIPGQDGGAGGRVQVTAMPGQDMSPYLGGIGGEPGRTYFQSHASRGNTYVRAGGGGGGGAAFGADGMDGDAGYAERYGDASNPLSGGYACKPGTGGNGAFPPEPSAPDIRGGGGHGGYGGGGGGGTGAAGYSDTHGDTRGGYTLGGASSGGSGSNGGIGGDGCVLLYYRAPAKTNSGQIMTADGRKLSDIHNREVLS